LVSQNPICKNFVLMQDAVNLAWKIALVVAGGGPASPSSGELLNTYQEERWPVAAHIISMSGRCHSH
jgi:2-polyprenyl-6-methoxyphenol hydroxylase-like FAD-dependent oxidoreductase